MAARFTYPLCSLMLIAGWGLSPALASANLDENNTTIAALDYCADQYVLSLADRHQIKALSVEADRDYAFYREKAEGIPKIKGAISEVLFHQPDIVLESYNAAPRLDEFTNRLEIKLLSLSYGFTQHDIYQNLDMLGIALDQRERADRLIDETRSALAALKSEPTSILTAAYLTPSGFTAGTGTFIDNIITVAGFQTYARKHALKGWLTLPVELIVMDPPDVVITSFYDTNLKSQSNWSHARHKRIQEMLATTPTIDLPGSMLACDGLFIVEAIRAIRGKAEALGLYNTDKGKD